ncbi:hypothetical protein I9018_31240 [Pseudomonas sp. MPFS]|uniref:beta-ketoacyl synthase N-terminal-like domain-containing protein n=1 Tax=Pseudomonas sp. MPFS TaxID=2795724 RepID=UPI001F131124|nr:beta-ketoacyl synthase N-terminal-like domain-containing protein [Pseudomonas sp. MPFS]UMZ11892.1 hypothetical protein I9018_31240 [Pseudomonas sp. MPFS]
MSTIYVSGLGAVTPIGIDVAQFWSALIHGQSNFIAQAPVYPGMKPNFQAGRIDNTQKALLKQRAPDATGPNVPDSSLYAVDAAMQAITDAGLSAGSAALRNALVCVGNNEAEADILDRLVEGDDEGWRNNTYSSHSIAQNVARAIGSVGPALCFHNTCASANVALEFALRMLDCGAVDTAVVGGGDAFSKKVWSGFYTLKALGEQQCKPFSRDRRHITISEGGAFVVLQRAEDVVSSPYAQLLAVASNNDAAHPTNPDLTGVSACHQRVLQQAGLQAGDISAIFAHGTGTRANDLTESTIFGRTYTSSSVTAIKGTVGHMMATAGAIGAVASCLSLRNQLLPPTNIDPESFEYDFDLVTQPGGVSRSLKYVQNNSFGFGGNNAISIFKVIEQ